MQPACDIGIGHRFVNIGMAEQRRRIGNGRVAAVQDAQFHQLVRGDIGDELDADFLQAWAPGGKAVLHHPLPERLAGNGRGVFDAKLVPHQRPFPVRRRRRNAIDHAVGKGDFGLDPAGQIRCHQAGKTGHRLPGYVAVFGKVIAGQDCEGRSALVLAQAEGSDQDAEHRLRVARVFRIMDDIRMCAVKAAGLGVDVIAAFGDGQ